MTHALGGIADIHYLSVCPSSFLNTSKLHVQYWNIHLAVYCATLSKCAIIQTWILLQK